MRTEAWAAAAVRAILVGNILHGHDSARYVDPITIGCKVRPLCSTELDGDFNHRPGAHVRRPAAQPRAAGPRCVGADPDVSGSGAGRRVLAVDYVSFRSAGCESDFRR